MKLLRLVVALAMALCSVSAIADQFNFSYSFGPSSNYTGSFAGDLNGQFVENISNVSVSINGTLFAGSPNLGHPGYDFSGNWFASIPAIVSFNGQLNSFIFIDCDTCDYFSSTYTNWFAMTSAFGNPSFPNASVILNGDNNRDPSTWVLTNVTAPIPEPETYAMLFAGLGVLGFVARRRKLKLATA